MWINWLRYLQIMQLRCTFWIVLSAPGEKEVGSGVYECVPSAEVGEHQWGNTCRSSKVWGLYLDTSSTHFKSYPAATTKISPVFNCSLNTGGSPSLNKAAYSGVNMTGDMLDLQVSFRSNKFVLLADIRKAFLMVRLALVADSNRFCFFVKDGDRLRCFRYATLILGSPPAPLYWGISWDSILPSTL